MTTLGLPGDKVCSTKSDDNVAELPVNYMQIPVDSSKANPVSIRFSAQWYPDVPTNDLFLNDESFPGTHMASERKMPLLSLHFGGWQGVDLLKLVALSVWIVAGEVLTGIDFKYSDGPGHNRRTKAFGRCGPVSLDHFRYMYGDDWDDENRSPSEKITFEINGPGGEIITAIDWDEDAFRKTGYLQGFRVG
jgi:U3 small nucleolar RNA-associated protein 4